MKRSVSAVVILFACSCACAEIVAHAPSDLVGSVRVSCDAPGLWKFRLARESSEAGVETFALALEAAAEEQPPAFTLSFFLPHRGVHHAWHPFEERFPVSWTSQDSSFSVGLPLRAHFDDSERNVMTFSLSEALLAVRFSSDIDMKDENAHHLSVSASFFGEVAAPRRRYETKIRLDARRVFWSDAVTDGARWIANASSRPPATPPPSAYEPLYSSWYVFRQGVTQQTLEDEIVRAAALGMKGVILDDGWQHERGDWAIDTAKFPDLRAQVDATHRRGLKYMLWLALAHVSQDSPARERFRGKFLSDEPNVWGLFVLDPRYPEVRRHLVGRLSALMRDLDLDGFKLDFIDELVVSADDPAARTGYRGCDVKGVPEAAEMLLRDVSAALKAIRPDALIEFRQRYIGPVVRRYGNMVRANDCPGDSQANRYRTLALRVSSPGSSVHSDMLLWRADDSPSEVLRQIWNVMFSTVQYSAYLGNLPESHLTAIRESINFLGRHRRTLTQGVIRPHRPELGYTWVEALADDERIVAVYDPAAVIPLDRAARTYLVNATTADRLVVRQDGALREISVPPSGIVSPRALTTPHVIEAESFADCGGWQTDQQFMDVMGSPYLLAHGLGTPVRDAVTTLALGKGRFDLWVRTRDWVAPNGPGRFEVWANGRGLGVFGQGGDGSWKWEKGASIDSDGSPVEIRLHDLTGFEGRVDALAFLPPGETPPARFDRDWRVRELGFPPEPRHLPTAQFVVVGGGFAGMCAAVSAARQGVRTVLVQDRPVFGGNGSSEVRVRSVGGLDDGPFPRNADLMKELVALIPKYQGEACGDNYRPDDKAFAAWLAAETNLTVYAPYRAVAATTNAYGAIESIVIRSVRTGEDFRLAGAFFADCTGDASLAERAGARTRWDAEPREETAEPIAPPEGERRRAGALGSSCLWYSREAAGPRLFPACPWALRIDADEDALVGGEIGKNWLHSGGWNWETGFYRDPVREGEAIRDHNFRAVYGFWDYLKNRSPFRERHANGEIYFLSYILGKRDAHRILGDYVLTANDLLENRVYPDGVVTTSWYLDLHFPHPALSRKFPDGEFRATAFDDPVWKKSAGEKRWVGRHLKIKAYPIPFRSFYSRDVPNLFMAGKNISGTYAALASYRVQNTAGMMGTMVGRAVSLCLRLGTTPRALGRDHLDELKAILANPGPSRAVTGR